jgi:hypothetical protein
MEAIEMQEPNPQLQATFDLTGLGVYTVPTNLYDFTLDMVMSDQYYVRHVYSRKQTGEYGYIPIQVIPEIELMLDYIQEQYNKSNSSDFVSNMTTYGHSRIQRRYNLNHKAMRTVKSRKIADGKLNDLATKYRWKKRLFENVEGGREQIIVYLDTDTVIAPTTQYRKSFKFSKSDLVQLYLCEAILQYPGLHKDNAVFFLETLGEFDERAIRFQEKIAEL